VTWQTDSYFGFNPLFRTAQVIAKIDRENTGKWKTKDHFAKMKGR
jgi:hypothetical protein